MNIVLRTPVIALSVAFVFGALHVQHRPYSTDEKKRLADDATELLHQRLNDIKDGKLGTFPSWLLRYAPPCFRIGYSHTFPGSFGVAASDMLIVNGREIGPLPAEVRIGWDGTNCSAKTKKEATKMIWRIIKNYDALARAGMMREARPSFAVTTQYQYIQRPSNTATSPIMAVGTKFDYPYP